MADFAVAPANAGAQRIRELLLRFLDAGFRRHDDASGFRRTDHASGLRRTDHASGFRRNDDACGLRRDALILVGSFIKDHSPVRHPEHRAADGSGTPSLSPCLNRTRRLLHWRSARGHGKRASAAREWHNLRERRAI
jgi:hypothetical protein